MIQNFHFAICILNKRFVIKGIHKIKKVLHSDVMKEQI